MIKYEYFCYFFNNNIQLNKIIKIIDDFNNLCMKSYINDIKKKINVIFPDIVTENYYLKNNNNIISNCTIYNFIW